MCCTQRIQKYDVNRQTLTIAVIQIYKENGQVATVLQIYTRYSELYIMKIQGDRKVRVLLRKYREVQRTVVK
jgi:hypothetical protein